MSSKNLRLYLEHILEGIDHIQRFLIGIDFEEYQANVEKRSSVERQLQIVTEAAFRLGDHAERLCPGPDWNAIRGLGNRLRHAYDQINHQRIWDTITYDLPPLRAAVQKAWDVPGPIRG